MAHPKRKTSKSVKNMRRSHLALTKVHLGTCPSCNAAKPSHRVCSACGFYDKERSIAI
jgi:large subunit ribosomal protein L32